MHCLARQTLKTRWDDSQQPLNTHVPYVWRRWLRDSGSLTKHLIQASQGHFSVDSPAPRCALPNVAESKALAIPQRQLAVIREVKLKGCGNVWVYARTVIPVSSLKGRLRQLHHIGNRSLGSILFSDRTMRRGPIEVCKLTDDTLGELFARRSLFFLSGHPLLVSEVFLPALLQVNYQP